MSHEHKPVYVGYRYLPPRSFLEIAHLQLRGRIFIWKCQECKERLEGVREEDMIVTKKAVFRELASERFGVGHKYDRVLFAPEKGQMKL